MGYALAVLVMLGIAWAVLKWLWDLIKVIASSAWIFTKGAVKVIWLPLLILLAILVIWSIIDSFIEKRVNEKSDICKKLKDLYEEAKKIQEPSNIDLTAQPLSVSAEEEPEEVFFIGQHTEIQRQLNLVKISHEQCNEIKKKYYSILEEYQKKMKTSSDNIPFEKYFVTRYTKNISNTVNNIPSTFSANVAFSWYGGETKNVRYSFDEIVRYNNRYDELVENRENRRRYQQEMEEKRIQQEEQKKKEEAERQARKVREEEQRKEAIKRERSKLNASLRYDVLKRDNFRCVICGRSAADGVTLHVDHIKPISKGGKTELNNLRTLCDYCNLGKSDKYDPDGMN